MRSITANNSSSTFFKKDLHVIIEQREFSNTSDQTLILSVSLGDSIGDKYRGQIKDYRDCWENDL